MKSQFRHVALFGKYHATVTGGAFVPNGAWGASFDGNYLFADGGSGQSCGEHGHGEWWRGSWLSGGGSLYEHDQHAVEFAGAHFNEDIDACDV